MSTSVSGQTIPVKYRDVLQLAEYQVLAGDVNGDTYPDVLVKAKTKIALIDFDVAIPIVIKPPSPTFILWSHSGGPYTVEINPASALIKNAAWIASSHDLVYGDVVGNDSNALLLRARALGGPNFVIVTSLSGQPQLIQQLTVTNVGEELSGPGKSLSLLDTNRDGRADLVVRSQGVMVSVLTADPSGIFSAPVGDEDKIMLAWRAFCVALDSRGHQLCSTVHFASLTREVRCGTRRPGPGNHWSDGELVQSSPHF